MKKMSVSSIFLSLLIVLFIACSKDDKVTVYRPPSADIHFSNVSDLIADSLGKSQSDLAGNLCLTAEQIPISPLQALPKPICLCSIVRQASFRQLNNNSNSNSI